MRNGRLKAELVITPDEGEHLSVMARSRSLPAALVLRAQLVLACEGSSNQEVAEQLRVHPATVGKWRRRFIEARMVGLHDELRPGKSRSIEDERIACLDTDLTPTLRTSAAWREQDDLLKAIPGIGAVTRATLLALLPELGTLGPQGNRCFGGGGAVPPGQRPTSGRTDPLGRASPGATHCTGRPSARCAATR